MVAHAQGQLWEGAISDGPSRSHFLEVTKGKAFYKLQPEIYLNPMPATS